MKTAHPTFLITYIVILLAFSATVQAQDASQSSKANRTKEAPAYDESVPKPTLAGIRYGKHERHVLDFWKAPSDNRLRSYSSFTAADGLAVARNESIVLPIPPP